MLPDYEGCLNLLQATYRLWSRDARTDPIEAAALADWLEVPPAELQAQLAGEGRTARDAQATTTGNPCPVCEGPVMVQPGRGRAPIYCGPACRERGATQRAWQRRRQRTRA